MDLLDITIPKHVVGKSLKPLMLNNTSNIRNSAQQNGKMDIQLKQNNIG